MDKVQIHTEFILWVGQLTSPNTHRVYFVGWTIDKSSYMGSIFYGLTFSVMKSFRRKKIQTQSQKLKFRMYQPSIMVLSENVSNHINKGIIIEALMLNI